MGRFLIVIDPDRADVMPTVIVGVNDDEIGAILGADTHGQPNQPQAKKWFQKKSGVGRRSLKCIELSRSDHL